MNEFARAAARFANSAHNRLYRSSKGRVGGRVKGMPVLLITVAGRKSGTPHTVPCVYLEDAGTWIVSGSAGGMAEEPQWFRNLRATDRATVEIRGVPTVVEVSVPDGERRDAIWDKLVAAAPFFAEYQAKVDRTIPVAVLTPVLAPEAGEERS